MKFILPSYLLAGLCASHLASATTTPQTSTGTRLDDLIPTPTPFPAYLDGGHPNLELRQNLGVNPGVVTQPAAGAQIPPVTVYSIVSQVGATGAQKMITYTQVFPKFPVPFPKPKAGTIGLGADQRRRKRELEEAALARETGVNTGIAGLQTQFVTVYEPIVLVMETVLVTQPLRLVTDVLVVQTVTLSGNQTAQPTHNATLPASNGTSVPASLGTAAYTALRTGLA